MGKVRTFFYVLRNSLINLDYYRELVGTKFSFSVKYFYGLLVLTALIGFLPLIVGIALVLPTLPKIIAQSKTSTETVYPQDLVLTIRNGSLSTNVPEPYYINVPGLDKHLLAIDTTANTGDYAKYGSWILATKNSMVTPKSEVAGDVQVTPLIDIVDNATVTHDSFLAIVNRIYAYKNYVTPFLVVLGLFLLTIGPLVAGGLMLAWNLVYLALFTVIARLLAGMTKLNLTYGQTYRLAIHASTLPVLFFALLSILGLVPAIPFGYSLILGVFMVIIFLHLKPKTV